MNSSNIAPMGSSKRSREVSDFLWTSRPPAKKVYGVLSSSVDDPHQARSQQPFFDTPSSYLTNLTPLATPTKKSRSPQGGDEFSFCYNHNSSNTHSNLETHFSDLKLYIPHKASEDVGNATHPIFMTAEIVEQILRFVVADATIPREKVRHRRKPQAFTHALLMCDGDEAKARRLWDCSTKPEVISVIDKRPRLHNCMQVNKMWHKIALSIITESLHFTDSKKVRKLAANASRLRNCLSKPSAFVLHKLSKLKQSDLNTMVPVVSSERLKWLEFYICPKILPPLPIFQKSLNLEKLVLPGNQLVDDEFLMKIAPYLTKLKTLDLRACDKITDGGVLSITTNCPELKVCNLGRHRNGNAITSVSMVALARNTKVDTVGVAGCHITDAGVWELAMHRGPLIRRLSLNNCQLLTDNSLPTLLALGYFPQLSVLEIRNLDRLTNVRPIVEYVRSKRSLGIPVLVEGGERLDSMIKKFEDRLELQESAHVLAAFAEWVNQDDMQ
ncbi:LAME_0H08482g1_1 [Lachancea meyersii CBS 8951]|uniref:LAME_0H08482g1_1 n=1 Tax=Lachancea meyersii CBS 8951 TaxID=1266667 RepID=A0A1G4KF58_9SACH|nr:LAME_0H08482g1_1 [Lachancea meyersii CBS 8951]